MNIKELECAISLKLMDNIGLITQSRICRFYNSFEEIFNDTERARAKIPFVGTKLNQAIRDFKKTDLLDKELKHIDAHNIECLSIFDFCYPERLKQIYSPPILLFYKGKINDYTDKYLSIVGTRKPSPLVEPIINDLINNLSVHKPVIVSGLAYGIDAMAHRAALKYGLPTIAVLGHGLSTLYPSYHRELAIEITRSEGALLTEFLFFQKAKKAHFPIRNRIIAGLSSGLIIAESKEKGGSMITGELAHSFDRELMVFPGRVGDKASSGCLKLIKEQKASLITCAGDVEKCMSWDGQIALRLNTLNVNNDAVLQQDHLKVYQLLLENDALDYNDIASCIEIDNNLLSLALINMEMEGWIKLDINGMYSIVRKVNKLN